MKPNLFLAGISGLVLAACSPGLKRYEALKEGRIVSEPARKMLVMTLKGDPASMGAEVMGLYKTYFRLKFKGKSMFQVPTARWPLHFDTPLDEWVAIWGLPVGDEISTLPEGTPSHHRLEVWGPGEVAEILHVGPYERETPTIDKLKRLIESSGYVIAGDHEEVYIKGPGASGKKNPEKYVTIIRYAVKRK